MLPQMLAEGIVNTHWFFDFNLHRVVDFNGMLKSNFDAMNELADQTKTNTIHYAVGEAQHVEAVQQAKEQSAADYYEHFAKGNTRPWRRL
jgi:hypothetical protein